MWKRILISAGLLALVGALAVQHASLRRLEREVTLLRSGSPAVPAAPATPSTAAPLTVPGETIVQRVPMDPAVYDRLTSLEESVSDLTLASEYLMERGTLPLAGAKLDEFLAQLNDPSASVQDRLRALQRLRRGNALDDTGVAIALTWLNTSTNAQVRQSILRNLEGMTNAAARAPLLQLAAYDADAEVREQAVDNLGRYAADPQVEAKLWEIVRTDADGEVREEAINALRRGPMSETRIAAMRDHAMDQRVPLDERLVALRALRGADSAIPQVMATLAQQAQASQDPQERAQLFAAFDGFTDPSLKVPLVYGLQDPNPVIRERAADALSGFRDDPSVLEWLQYIAQNDADPRVRREALQAMGSRGR